jgi:SAM-dependent methyltransferase
VSELPEHVARNRAEWDRWAGEWVEGGRRDWASEEPVWGIWRVPEAQVGMLPNEIEGKDSIELGCGTAYVSAWLARRGARPVGIDNSEAQLATAANLQAEHGISFPLHHGNAEQTPFEDESFDIAISEYGASIWCDPYAWIPEAARLLRPGGELVFLCNSPLAVMCIEDDPDATATPTLVKPYFGLHRVEYSDDDAVEFHLPHGEMIRLLRECGFDLEELIEVRPAEDNVTSYKWINLEWALQWPCEEIWRARKR